MKTNFRVTGISGLIIYPANPFESLGEITEEEKKARESKIMIIISEAVSAAGMTFFGSVKFAETAEMSNSFVLEAAIQQLSDDREEGAKQRNNHETISSEDTPVRVASETTHTTPKQKRKYVKRSKVWKKK